jgi:hypothetical protein
VIKSRILLASILILWVGFVYSIYFVVQRPLALQVGLALLSTSETLALTVLVLVDSAGLGQGITRQFFPTLDSAERFFLGTGLGLGFFGLLGFGLAAAGLARPLILSGILIGLAALAFLKGWLRLLWQDLLDLWQALRSPTERSLRWIPWFAGIAGLLAFLLAFAPPADSFDALLYHLAVPESWLNAGGLTQSQIVPHYWFPSLVEGAFVWGLAFGRETVASLLHFTWGILTVGLIWWWARKARNNSLAWRSVAVLISMPALPLLAAWAYTDLALAFYTAAGLYALWLAQKSTEKRTWVLSGLFCGLAMGVKYTSFILPLVVIGWMVWSLRRNLKDLLVTGIRFAFPAIIVAAPWYLRNWIWVGNPFYPFVFGGKNWDPFLAAHYSMPGTGIGLNWLHLLLLPLNLTLGQFDANYSDGRIGPLWLILLPVALWVAWHNRKQPERQALFIPLTFGAVSLVGWGVGVVNTATLWQSRLLFPALLPLAPLVAFAWETLSRLDSKKFQLSFVFNTLAILLIAVHLLDFSLFVISRNPVAVDLGITDRQVYFERFQPTYADALSLVSQTPPDAHIYFLFEPRSYGMDRAVTPDPINTNLGHDLYLYHTPESILYEWQSLGYSYVLYQRAGESLLENPELDQRLFSLLKVVAETPNTILYQVPSS